MAWWTSSDTEIKTKSRFLVAIGPSYLLTNVKSVSKPSVDIAEKAFKMLNHEFKFPTNAKWADVTIKFVDPSGNREAKGGVSTADMLFQMLNNMGYAYPYIDQSALNLKQYTGDNKHKIGFSDTERALTTPEKSSNIANSFGTGLVGKADFEADSITKQNVTIIGIDSDGIINEMWSLQNPIIKSLKFGDYAYDSDEPVEYELVVAYDWAVYRQDLLGKSSTSYTILELVKSFGKQVTADEFLTEEE